MNISMENHFHKRSGCACYYLLVFQSLSSWKVCADEIIYELSCDSCS
ncbi:hypothetical protein BDE02_08G040200 [Populus trichocarpa]|nr:hypothetical protein BDE02_08G040200 [Populus trichocarpa]